MKNDILVKKLNIVILLLWSFFLADEFIRNVSSFYVSHEITYEYLVEFLKQILVVATIIKLLLLKSYFWNYIIPSIVILFMWIINSYVRGDLSQSLFLFIVAFYGINYVKIAKIYMSVVGTCFAVSILLQLLGISAIRVAIGGRIGDSRIALGTMNSNSCGAIILLILMMWMISFGTTRINALFLLALELVIIGLFIIIQSATFLVAASLGLFLIFIENYIKDDCTIKRIIFRIVSLGPILVVLSSIILGLASKYFRIFDTNGLFGTLKSRLILAGRAFERFPITCWGTKIPYDDMGMMEVSTRGVFLLDNGWISILFNDGIVFLVLFFCMLQIPSFIGYKSKNNIVSIVILMFSLEVFMEACCQVVIYGPIWCMFLSKYIKRDITYEERKVL